MEIIFNLLSVLVVLCLIGAMLYATRAMKAKTDPIAKKQHLTKAGILFVAYGILSVLRMLMESNLP